ncbi:MAG: nitroreductase family protein [Kiritimatiellae bacterium]|nr:nitroreductase family protein [Kiritimatiellia bacterium]
MNFSELARARISVRGYRPDPVPEESLRSVLDTARMAPSAANRQPWTLVVVREAARRSALAAAYPRDWFAQAPVLIAVCVEPAAAWNRAQDGWNAAALDGAILMDHLTLAAADAGLGTCWICAFDPVCARAALNLPEGVIPVALTPLGYPADAGRPKSRKPLEEIVRYDRW